MSLNNQKKLLLHACCAPCTPYVIELLQREFEVTAFFYNPNIHPLEEYQHRLEEIKNFSEKVDLKLITGDYEADAWFRITQGMENEKEGGKRCELCYQMRLATTAERAHTNGFTHFATTLTVSPHKKATAINPIGRELQKKYPVAFYEADFKKHDGFKKSCELSTHYGFYRQNYCGCIYSQKR